MRRKIASALIAGGLIAGPFGASDASAVIYYGGATCNVGYGCVGDSAAADHSWDYHSASDSGTFRSFSTQIVDHMRNRNSSSQRAIYVFGAVFGSCVELQYDNRTWVNSDNVAFDTTYNNFTVNNPNLYGCPNA